MTNAEKFKEVFGFEPDPMVCVMPDCKTCKYVDDDICVDSFFKDTYKGVTPNGKEETT